MNTAYKHLDSKLRIAELTVGQWLLVIAGLFVAIVWGVYLSPLGATLTFTTSVYVVAFPLAVALFANLTEFDLWIVARSALAWRRRDGLYVAGAGTTAHGYAIAEDPTSARDVARPDEVDLVALWEEA